MIEENQMTIGILLDPDSDEILVRFHNVGDNFKQHKLAQYLHPKLLSIKQNIPSMKIQVHLTNDQDLFVSFDPVEQKNKFESFLHDWLPKIMKDYEE